MACETLIAHHQPSWAHATSHRFLQECKEGTISQQRFQYWLAQVGRGRCVGTAPPAHRGQ